MILTDDHFVFSSWRHGREYVRKDAILAYPSDASRLANFIAQRFANDEIDIVMGPAVAGSITSNRVAEHLSMWKGKEVLATYADRYGKDFVIRSYYGQMIPKHRVLIVDDTVNTSETVMRLIEQVRKLGGNVIGVGAICNRGSTTHRNLGVPKFEALIALDNFETWDENTCPMCKNNERPVNPHYGRGREFLARKQKQAS